MAASEHAIGTDLAAPGAEALSCDELRRRDCHATIHLSGTHSLHEGSFGSSSSTFAASISRPRRACQAVFAQTLGGCFPACAGGCGISPESAPARQTASATLIARAVQRRDFARRYATCTPSARKRALCRRSSANVMAICRAQRQSLHPRWARWSRTASSVATPTVKCAKYTRFATHDHKLYRYCHVDSCRGANSRLYSM